MELKNVTIKSIGEIKEFGDNKFKVVKFVVTTDDQYPQVLEIQCTQDKAENLLKYNKIGDNVDLSINLRGREWINPETKKVSVFNTIEAWKVFKADTNPEGLEHAQKVIDSAFEPAGDLNETQNDLPF